MRIALQRIKLSVWERSQRDNCLRASVNRTLDPSLLHPCETTRVLVDVREAGEYANERIAQSKNIPLAQLSEKLPQTVKSKSTPVLFLCAHGSRSARAAAIAKKLGYEQAYSVGGGMRNWKSANMPVSGGKA